jgi:hypothetical protein
MGSSLIQCDATTYRRYNGTHPRLRFLLSRIHAPAQSPARYDRDLHLVMFHSEWGPPVGEHRLYKLSYCSRSPGRRVHHVTSTPHATRLQQQDYNSTKNNICEKGMDLRKKALRLWRSRRSRSHTKDAAPATLDCDSPATHHKDRSLTTDRPGLDSAPEALDIATLMAILHPRPKNLRVLSRIENLPTELVEYIASNLLRKHPGFESDFSLTGYAECPGFDGLLELRATSRTLRAKTDFMFARCFGTHAVSFTDAGLLGLLELTYEENIRRRIRTLIFTAPNPNTEHERTFHEPKYMRKLDSAAQLPDVRHLLRYHPINTAIVAAALKRLCLTSVFVAPSLAYCCPVGHLSFERSMSTLPAATIFNATLISEITLECFDMGLLRWGSYEGTQPDQSCLSHLGMRSWIHLWSMTSLTLVLDTTGGKLSSSPIFSPVQKAN